MMMMMMMMMMTQVLFEVNVKARVLYPLDVRAITPKKESVMNLDCQHS